MKSTVVKIISVLVLCSTISACSFNSEKRSGDGDVNFGDVFGGEVCDQTFEPVCAEVVCSISGCSNEWKTFPNKCYAKRENTSQIKEGMCDDVINSDTGSIATGATNTSNVMVEEIN